MQIFREQSYSSCCPGEPFITAGTRLFFFPLTGAVGRNVLYRDSVFLPEVFKPLHVPLFAQELDYSQVIYGTIKKIMQEICLYILCHKYTDPQFTDLWFQKLPS